ncbi:MAG: DUF3088 family protein [Pseudomonadota bacterium]
MTRSAARASGLDQGRDILFLLAPGFESQSERQYCPECAELWGLIGYYPAIREALEIRYQPIAHPRPGIVAMLGEGSWNCPTLVLAEGHDAGPRAKVHAANGARFLDNARDIGAYFAHRYGTAMPRGFSSQA